MIYSHKLSFLLRLKNNSIPFKNIEKIIIYIKQMILQFHFYYNKIKLF